LARGTPRLAAHGWALGLALLLLALAPLGLRHSVAEARATTGSVVVPIKSSIDDGALRGPLTPAQAQLLPPPVRNRMDPGDGSDLTAVGPYGSSQPGANREHLVRFAWPTHGTITQTFFEWHPGIDIANQVGTPEDAAGAGQVVFAGWGGYGIYVEIDHGNGFHTLYGHMSAVLVTTGQVVTQGQLIGLMGATGRASGSHLHFEILYQGVPQNPIDLLS
jgi:murein DD-endopeptidase MepM/ murein hydrolase activator NlpD